MDAEESANNVTVVDGQQPSISAQTPPLRAMFNYETLDVLGTYKPPQGKRPDVDQDIPNQERYPIESKSFYLALKTLYRKKLNICNQIKVLIQGSFAPYLNFKMYTKRRLTEFYPENLRSQYQNIRE